MEYGVHCIVPSQNFHWRRDISLSGSETGSKVSLKRGPFGRTGRISEPTIGPGSWTVMRHIRTYWDNDRQGPDYSAVNSSLPKSPCNLTFLVPRDTLPRGSIPQHYLLTLPR